MKEVVCILILFLQTLPAAYGQTLLTVQDSVASYFDEIKAATAKQPQLWGKDLYGPLLLVNPVTRQLFANVPDSAGVLKQNGKIYTGVLPSEINIANTSINWNGRNWAMVMLPVPMRKQDRINLFAHELFHVLQPFLGFRLFNTDNNHLDQKEGRIYLRLELEALQKALLSGNKREQSKHLTNALVFRKYRHLLFKGADARENALELNEGLAEYTGVIITDRPQHENQIHFKQSLASFFKNPTFVRSFAYQTIPLYGYFLYRDNKHWNIGISVKTNLTDYFIEAMHVSLPPDLKTAVEQLAPGYNGEKIFTEETAREERTKKVIADLKRKYVDQPHFEIGFEQMQVSFDPGNIMPVEDKGTFYPNMRISDNWGILTVKNGALMSPDWSKVSVSVPLNSDSKPIAGDGWTLDLKDGYRITKDEATGNFKLIKK